MLLRQVQRPSSRSVAAAAWHSIPTAPLHGSSSRPQFSPPAPSRQDNAQPSNKSPSLFEKLFPYEAKQGHTQLNSIPKHPWASSQFSNEPDPSSLTVAEEFHFNHEDDDAPPGTGNGNGNGNDKSSDTLDPSSAFPLRAKAMLILSAASKNLHESDFLRLAPRGLHVEGWVGGITRVIQARDPDTLAPLGHYFVLFNSAVAAVAYRDEVERLWQLGKTYVPGAHHSKKGSERTMPVPEGLLADERGLDVAAAVKGFTLVPPSQRYHLELSTGYTREKIEDLDLGGAAFVDQLAAKAGTKHLVLVTVDGGRISVDTLRQAIEEDGLMRNLPWRVTDLENGIMPFGKSILKKHDRDAKTFEESLLDQAGRAVGKRGGNETHDEGGIVDDKKYRRYPRFIIPFTDAAEAQRFVRGWHRRQFKLRMEYEQEGKENVSWDETRTFNVSVLW
ncbi:hypothetical protein F4776DRAFT_117530 [Hypoxylon sp. NC0597]|nr:hypothetical protein F4776DRAFT_117530 [Hypoxylon sp. NC0597]